MKITFPISILLLAMNCALCATPEEIKRSFLERNPELVATMFALTSPEREIIAEEMIYQSNFTMLSADGVSKAKLESIAQHKESMTEWWTEIGSEMKTGNYLFQIELRDQNSKIICAGWIVLSKERVMRDDLLYLQNTKLN